MYSKKKKIIIIIILLFVFSLIPVTIRYKDGGTVEYKAVLYQVIQWQSINIKENISSKILYVYKGLEVKILGITVYNNAQAKEESDYK